jgi:dihydropyrimidine dehydrogenase (NAD+) subunit PreA
MNYKIVARIDQDLCIKCGLCYIACEDTSHQSIAAAKVDGKRQYRVIDEECIGCNLCMHVCPVPSCISMVQVDTGKPYLNWTQHPQNPMRKAAE